MSPKRIITIVKSSQNITIPSIQKSHKDSQVIYLRSTFQAENTLLPTPGSCVITVKCYQCVPAYSPANYSATALKVTILKICCAIGMLSDYV